MGFSGELWVLFVFVLVFLGFIWFLMWVQPILGNRLGILWKSVGDPLDVLRPFVGASVGRFGNLLGFSRVLIGNPLGLEKAKKTLSRNIVQAVLWTLPYPFVTGEWVKQIHHLRQIHFKWQLTIAVRTCISKWSTFKYTEALNDGILTSKGLW